MANVLCVWLDSGANCKSCRKVVLTFEELGITENDWNKKSEKEQEEIIKDIAFEQSDWGGSVMTEKEAARWEAS